TTCLMEIMTEDFGSHMVPGTTHLQAIRHVITTGEPILRRTPTPTSSGAMTSVRYLGYVHEKISELDLSEMLTCVKNWEQLCRYITRPAIANERLKRNRAGQVVLQLKSPYKDGTTHIVMEPLEFMERLAALVPRPRLHLIRFHGVLAPNA